MKSFKFLIATLLLGAAFVGCAQTGTSVTPSENETASSSQVVEESSSVVEESSSIVEESSSVVEESSSQAPVEVTYEATASLNLDLSAYDPVNQGDITLDSADPIAMGDFTALIKAGKEIIVKTNQSAFIKDLNEIAEEEAEVTTQDGKVVAPEAK